MKKLNLNGISVGLELVNSLAQENASIGHDELIDVSLIDLAEHNGYAEEDTAESIRELAEQIEVAGLLNPLGVVKCGSHYTLFSGERRYRAVTEYLHWRSVPCRVFEGVSPGRAQLMLHMANGAREYSPARKLALYEEYVELLRTLKESGEFTGAIQKGVANLLNVSDRTVRTYRQMAERLTTDELASVTSGNVEFTEAKRLAAQRAENQKSGNTSAFMTEADDEALLLQKLERQAKALLNTAARLPKSSAAKVLRSQLGEYLP